MGLGEIIVNIHFILVWSYICIILYIWTVKVYKLIIV